MSAFLCIFSHTSLAQTAFDSLKIKEPKHYFNTVILADFYQKPTQEILDTVNFISKKLKTYGIKQFIVNAQIPLYTIEDTINGVHKNTHVLLTANGMLLQPQFSGISNHNLVKFGAGLRYIHNTGKKGVFFADVAPFVTRDISYPSKPYYRVASTFIYSYNQSMFFNWRVGLTKSFMWGNRLYLPFVGIRVGRLDKVNFSFQFPRSISLNIPIKQRALISIYSKNQGGMFNFSNADSVYYLRNDATFHFTRFEVNTGIRADFKAHKNLNFYLALGTSSRNTITFYSTNKNRTNRAAPLRSFFYKQTFAPTLFINAGIVVKLGKTKSIYNNKNLYDAIDLNNTIGAGDNNTSNGNIQINNLRTKKSDANLNSIQDLIDYNDY